MVLHVAILRHCTAQLPTKQSRELQITGSLKRLAAFFTLIDVMLILARQVMLAKQVNLLCLCTRGILSEMCHWRSYEENAQKATLIPLKDEALH